MNTNNAPLAGRASARRIGYQVCDCGRPVCRQRRRDNRKAQRAVERRATRREIAAQLAA